MARRILYDDEHIRVLWQGGSSDFLLVTFGDLISLACDERFYGDVPVTKLGLACLGFMAKGPDWFPAASVRAAVREAEHLIGGFASRVSYGGSMGGYAAIKYSALLRVSDAIAFCPQWSVDPAECDGHETGYEHLFRPALRGTAIRPDDVAGRIFVLYDPGHAVDAFHFGRIARLGENVIPVPVHMAHHHVTTILAGTDALSDIIDSARSGDLGRLSAVVNQRRRDSSTRKTNVLRRAVLTHPMLAHRLLQHRPLCDHIGPHAAGELNASLAKTFIGRGQADLVWDVLARIERFARVHRTDLLHHLAVACERNTMLARGPILVTHHGTVLAYSALEGRLCHRPQQEIAEDAGDLHPVFLADVAGRQLLSILSPRKALVCCIEGERDVVLKETEAVGEDGPISLFSRTGATAVMQVRGHFVCAHASGEVCYDRTEAYAWERFEMVHHGGATEA